MSFFSAIWYLHITYIKFLLFFFPSAFLSFVFVDVVILVLFKLLEVTICITWRKIHVSKMWWIMSFNMMQVIVKQLPKCDSVVSDYNKLQLYCRYMTISIHSNHQKLCKFLKLSTISPKKIDNQFLSIWEKD